MEPSLINRMKSITFYKMSGSGNDFVIIDNRSKAVVEKYLSDFIVNVCRRKVSVGADGLILVENSDIADFKWRFFNSDGSKAEMCGNGAICVARFAYINRIAGSKMSFETETGIVYAKIEKNNSAKIKMPDPVDLMTDCSLQLENGTLFFDYINTGVPHVIVAVDKIDDVKITELGREIRFHQRFSPAGANVNFISGREDGVIAIRTYERGVEDETLACGTGSVAAAVVCANKSERKSPVKVLTRSGGYLFIYFKEKNGKISDIYLEGDARIIYKGELYEDAWN